MHNRLIIFTVSRSELKAEKNISTTSDIGINIGL